MGKGRKNRKPQSAPAPAPAQAVSPIASPISAPAPTRVPLARRIGLQFATILGLSTALGIIFNAANPIGVRFDATSSVVDLRTGPATNFHLLSTSSITAKTTTPVSQPTLPPPPVTQPAPIPLPSVAPTGVHTPPPVLVTNLPPVPTPVAGAVAPTNPAPIHWREAKPLVAAGQAVLVDVRPGPVYDAGHIPGAISLPETSSPAEFAAFLKQVPTNLTLIVYCSSTSCSQSQRVASRLVLEFHYASVKYMTGGYQEYQQEELAKPQPPTDR